MIVMAQKACILSIDGGGIRQIVPAMILKYIEEELWKISKTYRLSDFFDLFVGTDMGGILASVYVIPDDKGRSKYDSQEALDVFLKHGSEIFDVSIWKRLKSMGGMTDEKYSSRKLEALLNDLMGDNRLGDAVKPLMLTAYDVRNRQSNIYSYTDAKNPIRNFYLRDLCRASAAIPTYFETARVESETGTPFSLISGNLFAANPTMIAYAEARKFDFSKILNNPQKPLYPLAQDLFILSIGTGKVKNPYYYDSVKDWGNLNWLKPMIDITYSSNSETVDYQLRQLYNTTSVSDDYYRLNPKLVGKSSEIDDASEENIRNLVAISEEYIKTHKSELDQVVEKLIAYNRED